jgi:hypothetical protein
VSTLPSFSLHSDGEIGGGNECRESKANGFVFILEQFMDLELRKFNLVAIDCRSHGGTIGDVPEGYDFIVRLSPLSLSSRSLQF